MASILSWIKNVFTGENSDSDAIETVPIERIAIDQSGCFGSIYDQCTETFMGKIYPNLQLQTFTSCEPIICKLYKGRTPEAQNLLEMVGINQPLRLSIILKMIPPTGIASIITYPRSIDKYTRFLYFCHETRIESCYDDWFNRIKSRKILMSNTSNTCILTQIVWGIHVVVVLQLPFHQQNEINQLLEQICQNLIDNKYHVEMTPEKRGLLSQIISTKVYSNIPTLTTMTELYDVWQRIQQIKDSSNEHCRLKYIFSLVQPPNSDQNRNNMANTRLDQCMTENFENDLIQQLSELRVLQLRLDNELPELLQDKLEEQLTAARESFSEIQKLCENGMQQIGDLVIRLRKEEDVLNSISEMLNSDIQATIKDSIHRLMTSLDNLTTKGNLIRQLQNEGFEYCNVAKLAIDQECNEQLVKDILFKSNLEKAIFCSTDKLKQQSPEQWTALYSQIIKERQKKSQLSLIYADFTYSTFCLEQMIILSSKEQTIFRCQSTSAVTSRQGKRKAPLAPSKSRDEFINILLIGESGVGKSTFINAFANYLQFDSLEQAQSGKPIVVIPVSFLITVNDNFDEQLIKFGETDPNENHTNPGQSVTQQCRSYVFEISPGKKLRIIDSPGFGDTRGDNRDQMNMEGIFSFINNLTYLNGICLLFKPNVSRLNPLLYSCFTQLFQYFGENIRDHFIFCFTNARSTFFAPGDTGPLLKSLFNSFLVKNIPFEKRNTFCFDSESFRYLVALQRSLVFNEVEKDEFEKSWLRSVDESKRLRHFLCEKLSPYHKNVEWQSIQDAQFQINIMIRPILEAIRNILRNILLHKTNSSMKLSASCVDRPTMISYTYDRTLEKFGDFWILSDYLRPSPNTCTTNEQSPTEYRLGYEFLHDETNESIGTLKAQRKFLYETCTTFARFLITTQAKQDDPFLSGLIRMIKEEQFICQRHNESIFNQQLANKLEVLKTKYEHLFSKAYSCKEDERVSNIYKLIMSVNEIPMVKKQTDAIKTYQQLVLTSNEQDVSEHVTQF